jgi:hypothetical protein
MNTLKVIRYNKEYKNSWDSFVDEAKNATFLFKRDFMEYHKNRFEDFSLIVLKKHKIIALLPANIRANIVYSHEGLTYGGVIFEENNKAIECKFILDAIINYLKQFNIEEFRLKLIPILYNRLMTNDLDYFLFKNNGIVYKKNMNLAVDLRSNFKISKSKLKRFNRKQEPIIIKKDDFFDDFWIQVLEPRLMEKHNVKPIHSLDEIKELAKKFPNNIHQYSIYEENNIVGGITIFESKDCVKSQYGATTLRGQSIYALDILYIYLINKYKKEGKKFFDMGTVNIGDSFNIGLLNQKQELGCSVYNQDFYKLNLTNIIL